MSTTDPSPYEPPADSGSTSAAAAKLDEISSNEPDNDTSGIGLTTLTCLVVANMVGAGVFTSSGFSIGTLGNPGRVLFAWVVCGVWALCGAVAYGALIKRIPQSGGEYLFLSRLVHPSAGFLAGWISVIAGFTAPIAAAALGAAIYLMPGREQGSPTMTLVAIALIVIATACHVARLSLGTRVQNLIVFAKLVLILVTIVWAFFFTSSDDWAGSALPDQDDSWIPGDMGAWIIFVGSMSWIALSYTGFNAAVYVAGESKQARRNVPLAMLLGTGIVTAIYLLLNFVYVFAPAPDSIAFQADVATIAAAAVGGDSLQWLVRVTVVLSMSSSVFAMLLAGPRVYQKMAQDGVLPQFLTGRAGAPTQAILVQAVLSIIALLSADLLQLMKYLGLTLSACGALAVISLWWIRARLPSAQPLRSWENACLLIYVMITTMILAASWNEHRVEFIAMLTTFGIGLVVYFVWNQTKPSGQTIH
ncbi:MAG: amino acid permease [Planctomycetota bacterium]